MSNIDPGRGMNTTQTITLSGKTYSIARQGNQGMDLIGKRGASYALVQNVKNPTMYALIPGGTMKPRAQWFRKNEDGSFTAVQW